MDELKEYYIQVSQALTAVREMTGRIDDRMKTLIEKIDEQKIKLDHLVADVEEMNTRVSVLEMKKDNINEVTSDLHRLEVKVAALEIHHQRQGESKFSAVGDVIIKVIWAVAAVMVIYKLGFLTMPLQ